MVAIPEDRILVIFGSGRLGWLRQDFAADSTLRLRKLEDFVAPQRAPLSGIDFPRRPTKNLAAR